MAEMSMLEKVAKAIYEADDLWSAAFTWPEMGSKEQSADNYRRIARAAIEAMRPTSNRMDVAGCIHLRGNPSDASGCFEAMIDSALSEEVAG